MTVAKTACGFRRPGFAVSSVVGLSVGGPGLSEASWPVSVSAGTTSSIAACAQVAKIESDGELEHVEFRSQLVDRNLGLVSAIFGGPHGESNTTRLARHRSLPNMLALRSSCWFLSGEFPNLFSGPPATCCIEPITRLPEFSTWLHKQRSKRIALCSRSRR